jgi:hypothetical protein
MPSRIAQPLTMMMDFARQVVWLTALRLPDQDIEIMRDRVVSGPMWVQRAPAADRVPERI